MFVALALLCAGVIALKIRSGKNTRRRVSDRDTARALLRGQYGADGARFPRTPGRGRWL